jgi:hypothetical protein
MVLFELVNAISELNLANSQISRQFLLYKRFLAFPPLIEHHCKTGHPCAFMHQANPLNILLIAMVLQNN